MDETAIKKLLMDLGIAPNLAGYRCLVSAIQLYGADPGQSLTKEIYPAVGRTCRITGDQVERSIRYAIDAVWQNRVDEVWRQYFPLDRKPTNGEFISRVSEILGLRQMEKK